VGPGIIMLYFKLFNTNIGEWACLRACLHCRYKVSIGLAVSWLQELADETGDGITNSTLFLPTDTVSDCGGSSGHGLQRSKIGYDL